MDSQELLIHHGVRGMKWGVHKNTTPQVENRKVKGSDLGEITQLFNSLSVKDRKFLVLDLKLPFIKKNIRDGKHCFVAMDKGKIVGFMRESGRPGGFTLLEELVVDPKYRNKGVASKMLDDFHVSFPKTLAKTKSDNEGMNKLLKQKGYKADNPNAKMVINWIRDKDNTKKEKTIANKVLGNMLKEEDQDGKKELKHGGDIMADKTKSIKNATDKELDELLIRLRKEGELQSLIAELKRRSVPNYLSYDNPQISTEESIESLYHFGILGMKWGKHGSKINSTIKNSIKKDPSEDHIKKVNLKKKKLHQMSNSELRTLNERMQLERAYKDLNKKDVSSGRAFVEKTLTDIGSDIIKSTLREAVKKGFKI